MDVPLILEGEYIPEWRKNREAANPIKAILQPLPGGQRTECSILRFAAGNVVTGIDMPKLVEYGVKELQNLSASGEAITTGRGLVRSKGAGLEELILELAAEILVRNQEQDLKNS